MIQAKLLSTRAPKEFRALAKPCHLFEHLAETMQALELLSQHCASMPIFLLSARVCMMGDSEEGKDLDNVGGDGRGEVAHIRDVGERITGRDLLLYRNFS